MGCYIYSTLLFYIEKRFYYIYFIQRGAIVLLLSDGQSRALDTVVDDSPHAFFFSNNFLLGDRERKIYILMKKVLSLLAATALLTSCASVKSPLTGFLYNGTKAPVAVTENPLGTKKGEATAISVLGWVAVGDASVQTAARSAGITKISHVDEESTGGVYNRAFFKGKPQAKLAFTEISKYESYYPDDFPPKISNDSQETNKSNAELSDFSVSSFSDNKILKDALSNGYSAKESVVIQNAYNAYTRSALITKNAPEVLSTCSYKVF